MPGDAMLARAARISIFSCSRGGAIERLERTRGLSGTQSAQSANHVITQRVVGVEQCQERRQRAAARSLGQQIQDFGLYRLVGVGQRAKQHHFGTGAVHLAHDPECGAAQSGRGSVRQFEDLRVERATTRVLYHPNGAQPHRLINIGLKERSKTQLEVRCRHVSKCRGGGIPFLPGAVLQQLQQVRYGLDGLQGTDGAAGGRANLLALIPQQAEYPGQVVGGELTNLQGTLPYPHIGMSEQASER